MKKPSLQSSINKVRSELSWPFLEQPNEVPVIRIISDPHSRTHLFMIPDKLKRQSSDLDYLHELGHATLCEKVHPVFAANAQFAAQENKRQFLVILPALNAACDWFIYHWQMQIAPQAARDQLLENMPIAEEILGESTLPPLEIILEASLLIAQGIQYLQEPIECGGVLKIAVDAFLSVPPEKPSAENCVLLVNRLMATYTDQRARLVNDGAYHVWDVYQPAAGKGSIEAAGALQAQAL